MKGIATIKNIIFDLGGVLLDINPLITGKVLTEMGVVDMESVHVQLMKAQLYQRFDSGKCSPGSFRDEIREVCGIPLSDDQVDRAWNALLLDFPAPRVELLHKLKRHYRLFLLSNTNPVHFQSYTNGFLENYGEQMSDLFEQLFLSYQMGTHKPDPAIYQMVLQQGRLVAEETLFIDDSMENAMAAIGSGMHAFHLKPGMDVTELFINGKLHPEAEFLCA